MAARRIHRFHHCLQMHSHLRLSPFAHSRAGCLACLQRSFPFANRTLNFTNGHSLCMGRNIYMGEFTDELLGYGCVHRTKILDIDGDLRIQEVPRCYQLLSGHAATCHCLCNKIRGESSLALISLQSVRPGSRRSETCGKT